MRNTETVLTVVDPEQGLYSLLDVWSHVRRRLPNATLFVYADFSAWRASKHDAANRYLLLQTEERLRLMHEQKVVRIATMPDREELERVGVFAQFTVEDDVPLGLVIEAMRAGCRILGTAMNPIINLGRHATLLAGDILGPDTRVGMIEALVFAMTEPDHTGKLSMDRDLIRAKGEALEKVRVEAAAAAALAASI